MLVAQILGDRVLKLQLLEDNGEKNSREYLPYRKKEATYRGIYAGIKELSSRKVAQVIRSYLLSSRVEINLTDLQAKSLSILTSAWFLSEVSRNPVSLLSGLMLLDMMENNITYGANGKQFTLERVLWHPATIGDVYDNPTDENHGLDISNLKEKDDKFPEEEYWGASILWRIMDRL